MLDSNGYERRSLISAIGGDIAASWTDLSLFKKIVTAFTIGAFITGACYTGVRGAATWMVEWEEVGPRLESLEDTTAAISQWIEVHEDSVTRPSVRLLERVDSAVTAGQLRDARQDSMIRNMHADLSRLLRLAERNGCLIQSVAEGGNPYECR